MRTSLFLTVLFSFGAGLFAHAATLPVNPAAVAVLAPAAYLPALFAVLALSAFVCAIGSASIVLYAR